MGKWRPKYAPIMRKVGYNFRVIKSIDFVTITR